MQKRAVFLVLVLLGLGMSFRVGASADILSVFLRERNRFFELKGAEQLLPEQRVLLKESFRHTFERLLAARLRLENISSRLKERSLGVDSEIVQRASPRIVAADLALLSARNSLERSIPDFEGIFTTESPFDAFRDMRYSLNEQVHVRLQEAHTLLVEATLLLEGDYEKAN